MAVKEQVQRLQRSIPKWNQWRQTSPVRPDLRGADLRGADLNGADLRGADLRGANLTEASLSGATLTGANLTEATLSGATLTGADLTEATLSGATFGDTALGDTDLTTTTGLETIRHRCPSTINFHTVILPSPGPTLFTFLRGTGASEYLITALGPHPCPLDPTLVNVFISLAPDDNSICQQLRNHLSFLVRSKTIALTHEVVLAPEIDTWPSQTHPAFEQAHLILLLISAPFLASQQAWQDIIEPALRRRTDGSVRLLPILVRPSTWKETPLGALQPLPNEQPLSQWDHPDAALIQIAESIKQQITPFHALLTQQAEQQRERDLLTAQVILTKTQTTTITQELAQQQQRIQDAQEQLTRQEEHIRNAQKVYQELQTRLLETQQPAAVLQGNLASLTGTYHTLTDQLTTLDTDLQSTQQQLQQELSQLPKD